jgi:hypothetical protein
MLEGTPWCTLYGYSIEYTNQTQKDDKNVFID